MTSLADLLDRINGWCRAKSLDFPWRDGNNEREGREAVLRRDRTKADFQRRLKRVMEALGRRGGEKVGDVFVEDIPRPWSDPRVV